MLQARTQPALSRRLRGKLGNRPIVVHYVNRTSIEIVEGCFGKVDAKVLIDGGEEIMRTARALDHVFAAFVCGTDDIASLDAATNPQIGKSERPMITTRLLSARRTTRSTRAGAAFKGNARRATKLTGDYDQHTFVQPTRIDALNQR